MTLGNCLKRAERLYREKGAAMGQIATEARDEALYLILSTRGLPLESGPTVLSRDLSPTEYAAVDQVLRRRLEGHVPAAYITR